MDKTPSSCRNFMGDLLISPHGWNRIQARPAQTRPGNQPAGKLPSRHSVFHRESGRTELKLGDDGIDEKIFKLIRSVFRTSEIWNWQMCTK